MHPWTAIHLAIGLENDFHVFDKVGIFSAVSAGRALTPGIVPAHRHREDSAHECNWILVPVLYNELISHCFSREKMPRASDNISESLLIFRKNICTIRSGEAQWGRSLLETIPQNPANALELDS
jgi:hypothetical protein